MLKLVRNWQLHVGTEIAHNITKLDIEPTKPEGKFLKHLSTALDEALTILKQCQQVHRLKVEIELRESFPENTELLLRPIIALRNIRHTEVRVHGSSLFGQNYWWLKESYGRYMALVMALPEGAEIPEYTCDSDAEEEDADHRAVIVGIFDTYVRSPSVSESSSDRD
jgi:hypothetical protein